MRPDVALPDETVDAGPRRLADLARRAGDLGHATAFLRTYRT